MRRRQVEVVVFPVVQSKAPEQETKSPKSMKGFLKKYANPALVLQEKESWVTHVKEKYDSNL